MSECVSHIRETEDRRNIYINRRTGKWEILLLGGREANTVRSLPGYARSSFL